MELQIVTPKSPSNPQPTIGEAKPEAAATSVAPASTPPASSTSVSTATAGGAPGTEPPKPDKPGRRAAAAKRIEREASEAAAAANRTVEEAKPVTEKAAKYEAAIASGDVDQILKAFGIDDEKLVDMYLAKHGEKGEGAEKKPQDDQIRRELDELKQELAQGKVKEQEREAQKSIQTHVDTLKQIAAKPEHADRFEMLNAEGAHGLAFDVMVQFHTQHKKFLSYEEALDAVEEHLVATERARIERNAKIKKLGAAAAAKPEAKPTEAPAADPTDPLEKMRAAFKSVRPRMTNAMATSHPVSAPGPRTKADADTRFRERVLALATAAN